MIFGRLPLAEAEGAILAHGLSIAGRRVPKGTIVGAGFIQAAAREGLVRLWVARPEAGDVTEAEAAERLGQALAGTGTIAQPPVHGRVHLAAAHDGLFHFDPPALARANRQTETVGIATLPCHTPVQAGALLATIKIIPFAVNALELGDVLAQQTVLEVAPWTAPIAAVLIQTLGSATPARLIEKTARVTEDRLARFGWGLRQLAPVPHAVEPLAAVLREQRTQTGLILVAGAAATADRRDVVPAALARAGGQVTRLGMPVDPGNLLLLGGFDPGPAVIGLPGCARSPKRNGFDLVLERLAAGLPVDSATIAAMGAGGLLEGAGAALPWGWKR